LIFESILFALVFQYPRKNCELIKNQISLYYYAFFGSILLALIEVANVYLSLVISEVIAPAKVKLPFETLEELRNVSIIFLDAIKKNTSTDTSTSFVNIDALDWLDNDTIKSWKGLGRRYFRQFDPEDI